MCATFKCLTILGAGLLSVVGVLQADPATMAELRLANALGRGHGPLEVTLNDRPWNAAGLGPGEVSALRYLEEGVHRVGFRRQGIEPVEVRLKLDHGQRVTLMPHAVWVAERQDWVIKVFQLESSPAAAGRTLAFVDLGDGPRRLIEIRQAGRSWARLSLSRMQVQRVPILQPRGYLPIRCGGHQLPSLPVFETGEHVVVLYSDARGGIGSLRYRERPLFIGSQATLETP